MPIIVESPSVGVRLRPGDYVGRIIESDLAATLGDMTLGIVDDLGVRVHITALDGWWNGVGSTLDVTQRVGADGGWANLPYRKPRSIELGIELWGLDFDHVTPSLAAVIAAMPLRGSLLTVSKGTESLQAFVYLDGEPVVDRHADRAKLTVDLQAPDPRRYSVDMVTASTGLPQATGGLSLPLSLPLSVDATTGAGVFTATNEGTVDTPPTFTVQGPCPPFTIAHRTSGASLSFAEAVADGRTLTIDTARRLALIDGTATRTVTGTWFAYAPGDNEVAFSADSYDAGAVLTSVHRHAYL